MRRMSIGISLLILMPGITQAYCSSYSSSQCCTHYSPYAFGYGKTGLVTGCVRYSPYAFSANSSGLVFAGVRYSPYAFSHGTTGLVLDYCWWPSAYGVCSTACVPDKANRQYDNPTSACGSRSGPRDTRDASPGTYRTCGTAGKTPVAAPPASAGRSPQSGREDSLYVIRRCLRDQGCSNIAISRILRVDNKLVSVDFTLTDRNLLIKYWDPQQVERLNAKADSMQRVFSRYEANWERIAERHEQNGGTIRQITASGPEEIVAAVQSCIRPAPGQDAPHTQTLYAKE